MFRGGKILDEKLRGVLVGLVSVCFKQDVVVLTLYPSTLLHGPYFCLLCCWCFYCFVF